MTQITAALVKELRARTGAGITACKRALEATGGDVDKAVQKLRASSALNQWLDARFEYETAGFKNQFLVAMPGLDDENFERSVSLICEHNDKGAIGLVVNRPTELQIGGMLDQMKIPHEGLHHAGSLVFWGGPVQPERGFVIHRAPGGWESSMQVTEDLFITTSRDVLVAIGKGEGPQEFMIALGYAGWGAGQLEGEMLRNSWLNTPVDTDVLFHTAAKQRWQAATRLLGVEVTQLSGFSGHS